MLTNYSKLVFLEQTATVKALSRAVCDIRKLIVDYRKSNNSLNTNVCCFICFLFVFYYVMLSGLYSASSEMLHF